MGQLAVYVEVAPLLAYLVAFVSVVACVMLVACCAPNTSAPRLVGLLSALALLGVAQHDAAGGMQAKLCVLIALLMLGSGLGSVVGSRITSPGHLLFVAIVSGLADVWSVTQPGGISREIAEQPAALALLALPWPVLGTSEIPPLLGVGDAVFVGLYIAATRALGLAMRRTLFALLAGFALTTLCVVYFERPIAVLPWLGICFVIAQPKSRVVASDDRRRGAWVLTALAGVLAAWFLRRSL